MSLIEAVLKGHDKACKRDNVSSILIKILSSTGKNFFDSIVPRRYVIWTKTVEAQK